MATGRTISASFLNPIDRRAIEFCARIADTICEHIPQDELKKKFENDYGKHHLSRDAATGRGGGKLQRDALCTRGIQGKVPFSNRNLRWHPLVVAAQKPDFAKKIERIEIEGSDSSANFVFVIKDRNGVEASFHSDQVHQMDERFVALPEHWNTHIDELKNWDDLLWTQNSCVISAREASSWVDAVETYATLGIAVGVELYNANFTTLCDAVVKLLQAQNVDPNVTMPSQLFSMDEDDIVRCPVCKLRISENLERFRKFPRITTWQPAWRTSKKSEGDDSSIQIMHKNPLIENKPKHNASNVRYGHRWCNVAMTDHSIDETLDFMKFVVNAHKP